LLSWLDRHLWTVPILTFVAAEIGLSIAQAAMSGPALIAQTQPSIRQQIYSSLTGSSSSLLGFLIAAVAILAAFGPRTTSRVDRDSAHRERSLAGARSQLMSFMLTTSFFLLVVLVGSSLGLAIDARTVGNPVFCCVVLGGVLASVVGILISGFALALAVVERSRP
jgi:hypothetical protein